MLFFLALAASTGGSDVGQRPLDIVALYDQICLRAFPDDKAVEALMKAQDARELTPSEVAVTMRDDPARGWELRNPQATVWIEFPPYHACSVRWHAPDLPDLATYRAVSDAYERGTGDFAPISPLEADQGDIHIHAIGERRTLPGGGGESLYFIDQQISDPEKRKAGATGFVLRFVHQFAPPPSATR